MEVEEKEEDDGTTSRTELDSHANMPVVGRHVVVLANTGRDVDVNPFTPVSYTHLTLPTTPYV